MKTIKLLFICACALSQLTVFAQRKMETLDRGVVGIWKSASELYVSWRYLATDPEDIGFNVYRQSGAGTAVKLNAMPVTKTTNLTVTGQSGQSAVSRLFVKPVINGVEGAEEGSWELRNTWSSRVVRDYSFETISGFPNTQMTF